MHEHLLWGRHWHLGNTPACQHSMFSAFPKHSAPSTAFYFQPVVLGPPVPSQAPGLPAYSSSDFSSSSFSCWPLLWFMALWFHGGPAPFYLSSHGLCLPVASDFSLFPGSLSITEWEGGKRKEQPTLSTHHTLEPVPMLPAPAAPAAPCSMFEAASASPRLGSSHF